ncbi:MAG: hypothetical protein J7K35_06705 [Syntrophobacterales bacterium]|nr:hypothetical protein [Syntrophobacterales bacterium]
MHMVFFTTCSRKRLSRKHEKELDCGFRRNDNIRDFWIPVFAGMTRRYDGVSIMQISKVVTPVETGVQWFCDYLIFLDTGFYRYDKIKALDSAPVFTGVTAGMTHRNDIFY